MNESMVCSRYASVLPSLSCNVKPNFTLLCVLTTHLKSGKIPGTASAGDRPQKTLSSKNLYLTKCQPTFGVDNHKD